MKLTKTYLKKLIKEEFESIGDTHNFRFYYYSDRYKGRGDAGTAFFHDFNRSQLFGFCCRVRLRL